MSLIDTCFVALREGKIDDIIANRASLARLATTNGGDQEEKLQARAIAVMLYTLMFEKTCLISMGFLKQLSAIFFSPLFL